MILCKRSRTIGIVEIDIKLNTLSVLGKFLSPKSNFSNMGLYFYLQDVLKKRNKLAHLFCGKLEFTDLNRIYLQ